MIRMTISIVILIWLFSRIDIGAVFSAFSKISWPAWAGAFALYLFSQVLSSLRWFIIGRTLGFGGTFMTYIKFYFVGMYFNLFLPSAIGGDVLKAFFLARHGAGKLKATYSILSDRLFGLWGMFIIGAIASLSSVHSLPGKWRHLLFFLALSMTGAAMAVPFFTKAINSLGARLVTKQKILTKMLLALEYMVAFWRHPSSLFYALGLSILLQLCGMTGAYILGKALGIALEYCFYLSVLPLIAVLTVLPISFSGIGVREGGFIFFFHMKGVPMEKAVALSLSVFAIQAAAALIGGIGYLAGVHRQAISEK